MLPRLAFMCWLIASTLGACPGVSADPTEAARVLEGENLDPLPDSASSGARSLLARNPAFFTNLNGLSPPKLAARLNHLAFAHCRSDAPHTGLTDINELFDTCRTACGGYSYVLRSLLEEFEIPSRYVNFYNMPNQGNHSAVEAYVDGIWAFFDPTFGLYFTSDGTADGEPLTIQQVRLHTSATQLAGLAVHASHRDISMLTRTDTPQTRSGEIEIPYMSLANYLEAVSVIPVGLSPLLPMRLTLDVSAEGGASFGTPEVTRESGEAAFLKATNETLLDADGENNTSFHFSFLGQNGNYYQSLNIIELSNLQIGQDYKVSVTGENRGIDALVQAVSLDHRARFHEHPYWQLPDGAFTLTFVFQAKDANADIALTRIDNNTNNPSRIYGISVKRTGF